jgi:FKBP-type peptidyl-prolyl cis-trans isomerase
MLQERQEKSVAIERVAAVEFLTAEAAKKDAKTTESGLIYTVINAGKGASPSATDKVRVHYHGTLRDGTVFDSSVERGEPAEFPLNRVIACWTEGVAMMKEGGKSLLICPAEIAYGDRSTGRIPAGAALSFEVELIEIVE